ncbi:hypothetical protein PQQ63_28935 [Paraburkholderia metrosideri]|uniref:Uncharacterized protein n=1 Tax=Paraburkholderia metrosideri TaxID=580937 RepID=A0ABW9E1T4_9BURK
MEITTFGLLWLPLAMLSLALPLRIGAAFVIFASIFHAAAVLNIGQKGISPFFLCEIIFLVRYVLTIPRLPLNIPRWMFSGFVLNIIAVSTAMILPIVFDGVMIYTPDKGMDYAFMYGGSPLSFSAGNAAQCIYITVNMLVAFVFFASWKKIGQLYVFKISALTLLTTIAIGFWKLFSVMGYVDFPDDFFYSNAGLSQQFGQVVEGVNRINSTFTEASYFGGVMAACFYAVLSLESSAAYLLSIPVVIMLMATFSGSAAGAIALGAAIYFYIMGTRKIAIVALLLAVALMIIYWLGYGDVFEALIINKLSSGSAEVRTSADIYTFNLFIKTYGLGVGLGSHRTSSLALNLLGNIGALGAAAFATFLIRIIKASLTKFGKIDPFAKERKAVAIFLSVLLSAQLISIPDINFSPLWAAIFVSAAMCGSRKFYEKINANAYHAF